MCEEADEGEFECILALGDNTSAVGWIYRAGKLERTSAYFETVQMIARKIATLVLQYAVKLCAQHIS